jgi:hypothetical protein
MTCTQPDTHNQTNDNNTDKNTDNSGLTPEPASRLVVENPDYIAFARRIIRAAGRRVAAGDVEGLADLLGLSAVLDHAVTQAVAGLRQHGYSWGEIANRLGISRQAAQQRWGGDQS